MTVSDYTLSNGFNTVALPHAIIALGDDITLT
jgi:hypothetical protein